MTELLDLTSEEIAAVYLADSRTAEGRPWLVVNMIASLDGSAVVDGGSTALGGPPDKQVFRALRAVADVILVGAGTVRSEEYRAPTLPPELTEWRTQRGKSPRPRVAIVTESMRIHPTESLADSRPLVITTSQGATRADAAVREWAEVVTAGDDTIDPGAVVDSLGSAGADAVLLEGGPRLNATMAPFVDEFCLTVSPVLAGGDGWRIVRGAPARRSASLDRVIHSDGFLLLRYLFT